MIPNSELKLFLLILLIFFEYLFTYAQEKSSPGYLKIVCDVNNVQVLINGKTIGTTPLEIISLPPGKYLVTALNPHRMIWGNADWQQEITIIPSDTVHIQPHFLCLINIRTKPHGADLYLNDEYLGKTPLWIKKPASPGNKLCLKKEGYKDFWIDFDKYQQNHFNIKLEKDEEIYNLQKYLEIQHQKYKSRYRKVTYGLWAVSVISGLTSIYFKQQANENYEKYLTTGSLSKMNQYYDNSVRYDNYTNICLGIFQGSFLLSFYFFMKSSK